MLPLAEWSCAPGFYVAFSHEEEKEMNRAVLQIACSMLVAVVASSSVAWSQDRDAPPDGQPHFRAKQILGSKVSLQGDASVGTVDDIVLDESGNVDYLIDVNNEERLVT